MTYDGPLAHLCGVETSKVDPSHFVYQRTRLVCVRRHGQNTTIVRRKTSREAHLCRKLRNVQYLVLTRSKMWEDGPMASRWRSDGERMHANAATANTPAATRMSREERVARAVCQSALSLDHLQFHQGCRGRQLSVAGLRMNQIRSARVTSARLLWSPGQRIQRDSHRHSSKSLLSRVVDTA